MEHLILNTTLFICLFLLGISAVLHYSKNSVLPSVCWVLITGIAYGLLNHFEIPGLPHLHLEPELVFFVLLPILIFDSSRKIPFRELKSVLIEAGFFATLGLVGVALLIGFPFAIITKIPFLDAIFFGTIMAATDPVAVAAIFKNFSFPEKLSVLVEGESLLNDGPGVILYVIMSSILLKASAFSFQDSALKFSGAVIGAVIFGLVMGGITVSLTKRWHEVHDQFIGALLPLIGVYLTFIIAEHFLHVSGVISVMFCTMAMVGYHSKFQRKHTSKEEKADDFFNDFWDFLADLANNVLFFILGVGIGNHFYGISWSTIPFIIIILILSRSVVVYSSGTLFKVIGRSIPMNWLHVLNIGGLKGALSIALILLIPEEYEYRQLFHCSAFVMILFSLIGNSIAMRWYLNRASLTET